MKAARSSGVSAFRVTAVLAAPTAKALRPETSAAPTGVFRTSQSCQGSRLMWGLGKAPVLKRQMRPTLPGF